MKKKIKGLGSLRPLSLSLSLSLSTANAFRHFLLGFSFLILSSCGLNVVLQTPSFEGKGSKIKKSSPLGTVVGRVRADSPCPVGSTSYSLENNHGGLFKMNSEGEVKLAKENPAHGSYHLVVIGKCQSQNKRIAMAVTVSSSASKVVVKKIVGSNGAFAALRSDGSVVTWGVDSGGNSSSVASSLTSGVVEIIPAPMNSSFYDDSGGFAAIKEDGSIIRWGSRVGYPKPIGIVEKQVQTESFGFNLALKEDGSVEISSKYGGLVDSELEEELRSGVKNIYSSERGLSILAVKADGSSLVIGVDLAWGWRERHRLKIKGRLSFQIQKVYEFQETIGVWGEGGEFIYTNNVGTPMVFLESGAKEVCPVYTKSGQYHSATFAILKEDGSLIPYNLPGLFPVPYSGVRSVVTTGEGSKMFEINYAVLKEDGGVVVSGSTESAASDISSVKDDIKSGVEKVFANNFAFAALKTDGTVITWGDPARGGDSSSVANELAPREL